MMEWVRFILAAACMAMGLGILVMSVFGVYKFRYALNRMHAAAMGDTLGILFFLAGIAIYFGLCFTTLKIVLVIVFFWFASPVSGHLISRLEVTTNEELEKYCEVKRDGTV